MSDTETNPADCTCDFIHASEPTCRSVAPSRGAVSDAQRMFTSPRGLT